MLSARVCVQCFIFLQYFWLHNLAVDRPWRPKSNRTTKSMYKCKERNNTQKKREREVLLHAQSVSWSCIIVQNSVAAAQRSVVEAEDKLTYE